MPQGTCGWRANWTGDDGCLEIVEGGTLRWALTLAALCVALLAARWRSPAQQPADAAPAAVTAAARLREHRLRAYLVPPQPPQPHSRAVKQLLRGGGGPTARDGWIVARLAGSPYRIGFQNGYYTAQSADYWMRLFDGEPGGKGSKILARIARDYMWHKVPTRYRRELLGIRDGMRAAGYPAGLWRLVAANGWADVMCYAKLLPTGSRGFADPSASFRRGGCSAFIASGDATGQTTGPSPRARLDAGPAVLPYNVMYHVHPDKGYDLSYQSAGEQISERHGLVRERRRAAPDGDVAARRCHRPNRHTGVLARAQGCSVLGDRRRRRAHAAEGQQRL